MRFMPSSLSSKSHRLLTALVDSRHKKVFKVKNWITETDPEREKEERERVRILCESVSYTISLSMDGIGQKFQFCVLEDRTQHFTLFSLLLCCIQS